MTTRLAAVRRGDKRAYQGVLDEHGAALEVLARALGQEARLSATLIRLWRDAAYISATSDERAFVLSVGVRELARAMLPVELRLSPEHDPASMAFYLARGMTGIGDATDVEIARQLAETSRDHREVFDRCEAALREALAAPSGPLTNTELWSLLEPRLG